MWRRLGRQILHRRTIITSATRLSQDLGNIPALGRTAPVMAPLNPAAKVCVRSHRTRQPARIRARVSRVQDAGGPHLPRLRIPFVDGIPSTIPPAVLAVLIVLDHPWFCNVIHTQSQLLEVSDEPPSTETSTAPVDGHPRSEWMALKPIPGRVAKSHRRKTETIRMAARA